MEEGNLCHDCQTKLIVQERPPFPQLEGMLHSTYIPSNSEIMQVHTRIESANHDLDLYEAEIEKLLQTLSTLKQQRNELQRHRNCCRAVVSSFRRIPPELWAEIFLFALDNQPLLVAEHRIVAPRFLFRRHVRSGGM
ncbi:hypothetical protein D9758_015676 [Tetrapyrgos nigripes]|uniref:Uncharacterized protein n=1 Tax=Tetrapyrgos nigripes TaxID=182062 RepID=A0A8H5FH88_9AGAR|nr:hypothetical protein D9758_015676 [Tetrapyrgos nigripes]